MRSPWKLLAIVCLMVCALLSTGCALVAWAGANMPRSVDAQYKGLAKQRVAVMVWADRGIRIDYPTLQLDLGNTIQGTLMSKAKEDDVKEIVFPYEVRSVARFQKEHPELEGRGITEYAHRLSGITRLIYIEVNDFGTRSDAAVQLMRGSITANVKVVEIDKGKSKVAYEINNLRTFFPPKQKEGVIDVPEQAIYSGTVKDMGVQIAQLFYGHVVED